MPEKKRNRRLFQVAKELNVGTAMLVDHLNEKGHDITDSPNSKIDSDLYEMLLREFASEKQMKEKADLLTERRKEERQPGMPGTENGEKEEESEDDPISANDLRNKITPRPKRRRSSPDAPEELPKEDNPEKEENTSGTTTPEPVQEKPAENKAGADHPGLRVVGKIDLDAFKRKPARKGKPERQEQKRTEKPKARTERPEEKKPEDKKPPKQESRPQQKPGPEKERPVREKPEKERPAPVAKTEEKPVLETPKVEKPVPPVEKKAPVKETPPAPLPEKKQEIVEPKVVAKAEPPVQQQEPVVPQPQAKVETTAPKEVQTNPQDEDKVMRAGDRAPKLSGLKVMGKIELPGDKKRRKSKDEKDKKTENKSTDNRKEEKKTTTPGTNASGEEGDAKKKRRRRKRKRKPGTEASNQSNTNDKKTQNRGDGGGKAKPSSKEVDDSIRNTLSQIGKGPSRQRQRQRRAKRDAVAARREEMEQRAAEEAKNLELTEFITANEFANLINVPVNDIITKSFQLGMMVSINQRLDAELLTILGEEYGYDVSFVDVTEEELEIIQEEDSPEDLESRDPIITVMGHVDHGKTTLLDFLRKENVAAGEAGGITQHIGAYQVRVDDEHRVTFLDTPGHEAFTAMRARGAKVTDVAIVVVAADDAVMPQTREAINHLQVAEVPMVFAINKIDKAGADPEKIKSQLAEMNLLVDDWGGQIQSQEISALKGLNVDELLEKVIFEAEVLELKANPDREASGTVIESRLDKGRGNVATLLVENGTLKVGDEMVVGIHYGKVRALIDQNGERVKEAGPAMPVQVLGLTGQPTAGDKFYIFKEDGKAKTIANRRQELYREQQLRKNNRLTLEEIGRRKALGNFKELNIIIRADVDGSVEALSGSLMKLSNDEVQVNIIMKSVGAISEADVNLAIASEAIILAFNVRPNAQARNLAERESVDIRTYSVIYDAIDDVRDALEGLLSPELREEMMGTAEIKEVFKISKIGNVAGGLVTSGKIERDNPIRLIRDGVVISDGKLGSLKRFKDDVKDVVAGLEFGFTVDGYDHIQPGDIIESFKVNEIRRKLK